MKKKPNVMMLPGELTYSQTLLSKAKISHIILDNTMWSVLSNYSKFDLITRLID
jgi:hypothetical protein